MTNPKYMKKIFIAFLLFPALIYAEPDARLTHVTGKVYLQPKNLAHDQWIAAEANSPLAEGDVIRTADGSQAEVTLDGNSVILLSEKTELKADSLQNRLTRFFLSIGSLTAKIRKLRETDNQFQFKTPVAVAAVRGTELAVTYDETTENSDVGVFDEGQVSVEKEGQEPVLINEGQEVQVVKNAPIAAPQPIARLSIHRPDIVKARERIEFLKPQWKPLPALQRQEMRERLLAKPSERLEFKRPAHLRKNEQSIQKPPLKPLRPDIPDR